MYAFYNRSIKPSKKRTTFQIIKFYKIYFYVTFATAPALFNAALISLRSLLGEEFMFAEKVKKIM